MRIRADLRPVAVPGKGRFKPEGAVRVHGAPPRTLGPRLVAARHERAGAQILSARFLAGFNVHGQPHWTEEDLIRLFVQIREKQGRAAGASFLSQRGIWQPLGGRREPDEAGAQIIVMNDRQLDEDVFADEMAALGEELAHRMDQAAIYLDIQMAGQVVQALTLTQE